MTIPQLAAATGLTNGFHQPARARPHLASLARSPRRCDVRLGHLVDGTPPGEAQATLELSRPGARPSSAPDEMRFHVTESHIERAQATAGEEVYTLPADVEIVSVVEGSLELQVPAPGTRSPPATRSATRRARPTRGATRRRRSRAVVLWLAVPNPYAQL